MREALIRKIAEMIVFLGKDKSIDENVSRKFKYFIRETLTHREQIKLSVLMMYEMGGVDERTVGILSEDDK